MAFREFFLWFIYSHLVCAIVMFIMVLPAWVGMSIFFHKSRKEIDDEIANSKEAH